MWSMINKAMVHKTCLRINYLKPKVGWSNGAPCQEWELSDRKILPYRIEQMRDGRTLVYAWCFTRNAERVFRLDRIQLCEPAEPPKELPWQLLALQRESWLPTAFPGPRPSRNARVAAKSWR